MKKIGILGAGAWGTALAISLSREKKEVYIQAKLVPISTDIFKDKTWDAV